MNYNAVISVHDISDDSGAIVEPVTVAELKNYMRSEGFADPTSVNPEVPLSVSLAQGSTTYQNSLLIGAVILSLARSGTVYTQGLVAGNLVFSFDNTTGTITFQNAGNTGGENLAINYGFSNGSGVFNFTGDDTLMSELITAARQMIENIAGISIIPHTWEAWLNNGNEMQELPNGPNAVVWNIKDSSGNVIDATSYKIVGNFWNYIEKPLCKKIVVTYQAGYVFLPKGLKIDIMRLATYLYENRGEDASIAKFGYDIASKYIRQLVA